MDRFPNQAVPILSIKFHHKNETRQSLQAIFCSLLRQLISQSVPAEIPLHLRQIWSQRRLGGYNSLTEYEARQFLVEELQRRPLKFLIVDALDEAIGCLGSIRRELRNLRTETGCCIFQTDRLDPRKVQALTFCDNCQRDTNYLYWQCLRCPGAILGHYALCRKCYKDDKKRCPVGTHEMKIPERLNVAVAPQPNDIEQFVSKLLERELDLDDTGDEDSELYSGDIPSLVYVKNDLGSGWNSISTMISEAAGDSYLVADLIVARLKRQATAGAAKKLLEGLGTVKQGIVGDQYDYLLKEQYDDMLSLCLGKADRDAGMVAYDHLSSVSCAQEVLSFQQLSHAVAVRKGDKSIQDIEIRCCRKEIVRKHTDGLLSIGDFGDPDMLAVSFFHRTLATYLEQNEERWFPDANQKMFDACMAYLKLEVFSKYYSSMKDLDERLLEYPFASYAACYWAEHLRRASLKEENLLEVLELFNSSERMSTVMQIAWYARSHAVVAWDVMEHVSLLHLSAFYGLTGLCKLLLKDDLDPNIAEETYGQTPIHYACRRGYSEVLELLLNAGGNVNIPSARGRTPLMEAIANDKAHIVDLLLEHPAVDVNIRNGESDQLTALIFASEYGKAESVGKLVKHGNIRINQVDRGGCSALFWAISSTNAECVRLILDHPELDIQLTDNNGETALDYIARADYDVDPDSVEHITSLLMNKSRCPPLGDLALQYLIEDDKFGLLEIILPLNSYAHWRDKHGRTLLHLAAFTGDESLSKLIYAHLKESPGFDIDTVDQYGSTALHASCQRISIDHGAVVTYLLAQGADATKTNARGLSPIDIAKQSADHNSCWEDFINIFKSFISTQRSTTNNRARRISIESLVDSGDATRLFEAVSRMKDPLQLDPDPYTGATALQMAINWHGPPRPDILEILLPKCKPYINAVDEGGRTCLHSAANRGCAESIKLLLDAGAEINIRDNWHDTPFEHAQRDKQHQGYDAAFILINHGALLPQPNKIRKDLLHCAVDKAEVNIVKKLIEAGVDLYHRKNALGPTALDLAIDRRRVCINTAKNDMVNNRQWRDFRDADAFDRAALDLPQVKALNEIIDSLQDAQKRIMKPKRRKHAKEDFSDLIQTMRKHLQKRRGPISSEEGQEQEHKEKDNRELSSAASSDIAIRTAPEKGDTVIKIIDLGNGGGMAIAVAISVIGIAWLWLRYQESLIAGRSI